MRKSVRPRRDAEAHRFYKGAAMSRKNKNTNLRNSKPVVSRKIAKIKMTKHIFDGEQHHIAPAKVKVIKPLPKLHALIDSAAQFKGQTRKQKKNYIKPRTDMDAMEVEDPLWKSENYSMGYMRRKHIHKQ